MQDRSLDLLKTLSNLRDEYLLKRNTLNLSGCIETIDRSREIIKALVCDGKNIDDIYLYWMEIGLEPENDPFIFNIKSLMNRTNHENC